MYLQALIKSSPVTVYEQLYTIDYSKCIFTVNFLLEVPGSTRDPIIFIQGAACIGKEDRLQNVGLTMHPTVLTTEYINTLTFIDSYSSNCVTN